MWYNIRRSLKKGALMSLIEQIKSINPSAKDPLFRRLLRDEDLGYLRDGEKIIGFEIDINHSKELSGYTMIGVQKHTILAFKSDLNEEDRLIIFPSMDKLFDEAFELLDLTVIKQEFTNSDFKGKVLDKGVLRRVVSDLTPPLRSVELPQGVSEAMVQAMLEENANSVRATSKPTPQPTSKPTQQPTPQLTQQPTPQQPTPQPKPQPQPQQKEMTKLEELRAQKFTDLADIADFVVVYHSIPREIATQVINGALSASSNPEVRIEVAIQLFGKIYEKFGK